MRKVFLGLLLLLSLTMSLAAENAIMKEKVHVWSDRKQYLLVGLPQELKFKKAVPKQRCSAREIVFPEGSKRAMVGLYDCAAAKLIARKGGFKAYNGTFRVAGLNFQIYIVENPPKKIDCRATNTGGVLLALDDDVPEITVSKTKKSSGPGWKGLQQMQKFPGQEYRFAPGSREVQMYVREPVNGINADTGLMLLLHNWGGTWKQTVPWCNALADRYNLVTISVNYLQSGESKHDKVPYDHGLLQAMDCLRAVYTVAQQLKKSGVKWNSKRLYAAGGSGGGNVSQMVNKLAPASFACIVDMCGMPGLTEDIAFGRGNLNAGYSQDPKSSKFLTAAMREIRDPGNPHHLARQKKVNPNNKVVIVHGQDDCYCSVVDKITIFKNMIKAGFRPSGYFLTESDIDGKVITTTGHAIGNRLKVIERYAGRFLEENGDFSRKNSQVE